MLCLAITIDDSHQKRSSQVSILLDFSLGKPKDFGQDPIMLRSVHSRFLLSLSAFVALATLSGADTYDWIIENARIADGTGAPLVSGRIAFRDGRIAAVGDFPGTAPEILDATGLIAAPGFIDVHTHSEDILKIPEAENFVRMGLTTIITGNCGNSFTDIGQFFRDLEQAHPSLNVATLIGHGSIRKKVMKGSFMRPPRDSELAAMRDMVEQAMKDGAVGLSTGLIYVPGTYAKSDEIIALAKIVHAHGGIYASHMRSDDLTVMASVDELLHIARESGCRAELSHIKLKGPSAWGMADALLAKLDQARAEGIDITQDQYMYTASSTTLGIMVPTAAMEGTHQDFVNRLADPVKKAEIIAGMRKIIDSRGFKDYSHVSIANCSADSSLNGKNIAQAAEKLRGNASLDHQIETILDLLTRGRVSAIFHSMSEGNLETFLRHPLTMIACDGWPFRIGPDVPHPRSYGDNARVLARYVREKKLLTVEDAIRKMTSLPAQTFQLEDRGQIAVGYHADLVLFDPESVNDPATFDNPHQYAEGIPYVFVNGLPVIFDGQDTGERPGQAVRKGIKEIGVTP